MVWRNAAKIIFAAGEALTKAFARAVRDELRASKQAAARYAEQTGSSAADARRAGETNARLGISLQESMQILNVKEPLNKEEVEAKYKHLFDVNDKSKGGSLYLQSKVYRAKERIDEEFRERSSDAEPPVQEVQEVKKEEVRKEESGR
ncbi:Mitochondrial import inner membrane translocase subunit tim-16 [Toxocara canis]|uniref:Mitochondrial import inner membrane translocase subunit tim-16 n=1 Tax=Toxocara canis TaxID=6265 RepID=A0A0B2VKB0_TOXCA|nr:Mitochondrial import inner membrane translocase subunit tim-16 [Toxocara canis]